MPSVLLNPQIVFKDDRVVCVTLEQVSVGRGVLTQVRGVFIRSENRDRQLEEVMQHIESKKQRKAAG